MNDYTFRNFYITPHMMKGINNYVEHGLKPGDFLTAIITNDLMEAVGRADHENIGNIPAFVSYFYNEAPSDCWGSEEKMKLWMEKKLEERVATPKIT